MPGQESSQVRRAQSARSDDGLGSRGLLAGAGRVGRARLLDDFVGSDKDGLRDAQPKCLRGLEVYCQLELCRLFYRKITRLRALEDLVDEGHYLLNHRQQAWSIGDEAPRVRELS